MQIYLVVCEGLQLPVKVLRHPEALQDRRELDILVNDTFLQHGMQWCCTGQGEVTCNTNSSIESRDQFC